MFKKALLVLIAAIISIIYIDVKYPRTNSIEVISEKLINGSSFKILQLSDYHNSKHKDFVLKNILSLNPDIIVITGDLLDERTNSFENIYTLIEEIIKIIPNVYFVCGNHEWKNRNRIEFLQGLVSRKVKLLNNKNMTININGNKINICGIDDFHTNHSQLDKATQGIDNGIFTMLLSHTPDVIKKLNNSHMDMILSGHTHGGQVRLPLIGAIVAPGQGLLPKYSKGVYNIGEDTLLYIDSGLGNSKIPLRLLNRSQLSLITIRGK